MSKAKTPAWIDRLAAEATDCVSPEIPMVGVSYCWKPRSRRRDLPYRIAMFPTKVEVLEQGPRDGEVLQVGIKVCLSEVMLLFDDLPHLDWCVPTQYDGDLDGPCVVVRGEYGSRPVELSIFDRPPKDFETVTVFDVDAGECHVKGESPCSDNS